MTSALDELLGAFRALPDADRASLRETALAGTAGMKWIPNSGPQTQAYFCEADELFYGGQAGGGKTHLVIGCAINEHKRSLILRRVNKDAVKIVPFIAEVTGNRDGYNGQLQRWMLPGQQIDIAGCEYEDDKQRFKGDPHDLIAFDEGTDFLESQYRFIIGWNRSSDASQRCRVLVTSNPPTTSEGRWVIKYWGPWLDPTHPRPAKPGELRWFTTVGGEDMEVDGPGPHVIAGESEPIMARSRSFIPAALSDNPYLANTNYAATLAALPDELRRAYRDGDFTVGTVDSDFQVIPTRWIVEAQNRWTPQRPEGKSQVAIAADIAQGGKDQTVISARYGGWFAPQIVKPGAETPDGASVAALILTNRRDASTIILDMGGGYGGATKEKFDENGIPVVGFNGANASSKKTRDGKLDFYNRRAEAYWTMREELDPEQEGGSPIALPPDPDLRAQLAAATFKVTPRGIQVEAKDKIKERLGVSPDKSDSAVMCLAEGKRAETRTKRRGASNVHNLPTRANVGYAHIKQRIGA